MLNPQHARLILTIALVINANVFFSLLATPVWAQTTSSNEVRPETNVQPVTTPLTKPNGTHGKTSATTSDKKSISAWTSLNPAQQEILAPLELSLIHI